MHVVLNGARMKNEYLSYTLYRADIIRWWISTFNRLPVGSRFSAVKAESAMGEIFHPHLNLDSWNCALCNECLARVRVDLLQAPSHISIYLVTIDVYIIYIIHGKTNNFLHQTQYLILTNLYCAFYSVFSYLFMLEFKCCLLSVYINWKNYFYYWREKTEIYYL